MIENYFKLPNITVEVIYRDSNNRVVCLKAIVRYTDDNDTYLVIDNKRSFETPKPKTKVEVRALVPGGVFSSNVKIQDTSATLSDFTFIINTPRSWVNKEIRRCKRKKASIPVIIKYKNAEINATSSNISDGGISLLYDKPLSMEYKSQNAEIIIKIPNSDDIVVIGKFLRERMVELGFYRPIAAFKFISISPMSKIALKNYLMTVQQI